MITAESKGSKRRALLLLPCALYGARNHSSLFLFKAGGYLRPDLDLVLPFLPPLLREPLTTNQPSTSNQTSTSTSPTSPNSTSLQLNLQLQLRLQLQLHCRRRCQATCSSPLASTGAPTSLRSCCLKKCSRRDCKCLMVLMVTKKEF